MKGPTLTIEMIPENQIDVAIHQVFIEGGVIQKPWGLETHAYSDHLLRMDAESRRNCFCGTVADDIIRTHTAAARGSDVIFHGFFLNGVLRGAANLHIFGRHAEAALSIEKPWRSLGIGSALLERSLLAARNRGIELLQVFFLAENQRMLQLARKFQAELTFDYGMVIGKMENPHPTPLSLMQEMVLDFLAFVVFQSSLLMALGVLAERPPHPRLLQVH